MKKRIYFFLNGDSKLVYIIKYLFMLKSSAYSIFKGENCNSSIS